jgi:hypothetical protein
MRVSAASHARPAHAHVVGHFSHPPLALLFVVILVKWVAAAGAFEIGEVLV